VVDIVSNQSNDVGVDRRHDDAERTVSQRGQYQQSGGCVFPIGVAACHGHCSSCRCS